MSTSSMKNSVAESFVNLITNKSEYAQRALDEANKYKRDKEMFMAEMEKQKQQPPK